MAACDEPAAQRPGGSRVARATVALWCAAVLAVLVNAVVTLRRPEPDRMADLQVYLGSVRTLLDGGSLYDFAAWNGAPFTYPPFAGIVFLPLPALGPDAARLLWLGALVGALVVLAVVVRRCAGPPARDAAGWLPGVLLVCAVSAPVASNIRFGQVSLFLVLLVVLDEAAVVPARLRGVATGLAAALKLTPAVFVLYWWLTGRRAEAGRAVAAAAVATALAWVALPEDSARYWGGLVLSADRVGDLGAVGNQSLRGLLLRWGAPEPWVPASAALLGLAVLACAVVRARRAYRGGDPLASAVIVGAAGLALSPVSWTHHQVWLVLAVFVPAGATRAARWVWAGALVLFALLPLGPWGGGVWRGFGENARALLAVAVAVAVPFRAVAPPGHGGGAAGGAGGPAPGAARHAVHAGGSR